MQRGNLANRCGAKSLSMTRLVSTSSWCRQRLIACSRCHQCPNICVIGQRCQQRQRHQCPELCLMQRSQRRQLHLCPEICLVNGPGPVLAVEPSARRQLQRRQRRQRTSFGSGARRVANGTASEAAIRGTTRPFFAVSAECEEGEGGRGGEGGTYISLYIYIYV